MTDHTLGTNRCGACEHPRHTHPLNLTQGGRLCRQRGCDCVGFITNPDVRQAIEDEAVLAHTTYKTVEYINKWKALQTGIMAASLNREAVTMAFPDKEQDAPFGENHFVYILAQREIDSLEASLLKLGVNDFE